MSDIDIIENIGNDFRHYTDTSCSRCGEKSVCAPLAIGGGGKIKRYYLWGMSCLFRFVFCGKEK